MDTAFVARTLALSLVFALAGFIFASTADSRAAVTGATAMAPRAVGSSAIRFTNAFAAGGDQPDPTPDTFDLGFVAIGSSFTRYITAVGGVRPYRFTSPAFQALAAGRPESTATLRQGGLLSGVLTGAAGNITFAAIVTDTFCPTSVSLNANFNLELRTVGAGDFRFGVNRLNNGAVGLHYISKLDTVGGIDPVRYSILPNTLQVNGAFKGNDTRLESIGLSLADDGTVYGRPLQAGTIQFTARAIDPAGTIARDTTGAVQDQQITFTITENSVVQTDFASFNVSIKGQTAKLGKDTIKFDGHFNIPNLRVTELNGFLFSFRLGGSTYSGRIDRTGKVVSPNTGRPLRFADGSQMSAKVDVRSGRVSGQITKASLANAVDAVNVENRALKQLAVGLSISDIAMASDTLNFSTRRVGDKYQLDYKLGKMGQSQGGTFHIVSATGKDGLTTAGQDGTAWKVRFIAIPRFGLDQAAGTDAVDSATVKIGANFSQAVPGASIVSKSGKLTFKDATASGERLLSFNYDTVRFTGDALSLPLTTLRTGIPTAGSFPKPAPPAPGVVPVDPRLQARNFTFGFELDRSGSNADFKGECGKVVTPMPNAGTYVDSGR